WAYSAESSGDFYLRFIMYSLILTLWLPPAYALMLGLVLPRMRGITFSTYMIIQTLLGLGLGPYFVGIVADRNGGDLGNAILSINVVVPFIVVLLLVVLVRFRTDEDSIIDRARAGGEPI
ncbi:MAG TPA: hypothetical protein VLA45_19030, partial [Paracoccaceae bacterium]|nr:hypothetical protein [Paracoccaceae bacterium]